MNVAELIEQLHRFPPDMTVTVDGYEGGVTETVAVDAIYVERDTNHVGHYGGEHDPIVPSPDDPIENYPDRAPVVNITRTNHDCYAKVDEAPSAVSP